jgi:hypothetical protein
MYCVNSAAVFAAKTECDSALGSAPRFGEGSTEAINASPNSKQNLHQRFRGLLVASRGLRLLFASALLCTTIVGEAHAASVGCNGASTNLAANSSGSLATSLLFDAGDTVQISTSSPSFAATVSGANSGAITSSGGTLFLQNNGFTSISVSNTDSHSANFSYSCTTTGSTAVNGAAPPTGTTAGGTSVVIIGTNFVGATAVTFGGNPAAAFTVAPTGQTISATTPPGTLGKVDIVVSVPQNTATGSQLYTYAQASTTTSVVSSANPSPNGQVSFTATVTSPGGGVPTGTVTFVLDNATTLGSSTLSPNGSGATTTLTPSSPIPTGSHTITATYNGDANFTGSSGQLTQKDLIATTTTVATSQSPSVFGHLHRNRGRRRRYANRNRNVL